MVAAGLGWPEGPTALPDGRLVFVESYRSQLTVVGAHRGAPRRFAYVAGAPNSCVLGAKGWVYVCQNGGTVGPWRAAEMVAPSIQRVREGGKAEVLITEVEGIRLNGPNDLVFAPDGRLHLHRSRHLQSGESGPELHPRALAPDGSAKVVVAFPEPVFPNGLAVEFDGSIVWGESYTGHVRRRRPDGMIEDLGRLPGKTPTPDGMKVGADGRLFVADIAAGGIRVLARDGEVEVFIAVGKTPTNCCFDGETLWVTDAGVLADSTEPSSAGQLWRFMSPAEARKPVSAILTWAEQTGVYRTKRKARGLWRKRVDPGGGPYGCLLRRAVGGCVAMARTQPRHAGACEPGHPACDCGGAYSLIPAAGSPASSRPAGRSPGASRDRPDARRASRRDRPLGRLDPACSADPAQRTSAQHYPSAGICAPCSSTARCAAISPGSTDDLDNANVG